MRSWLVNKRKALTSVIPWKFWVPGTRGSIRVTAKRGEWKAEEQGTKKDVIKRNQAASAIRIFFLVFCCKSVDFGLNGN